MADFVLEREIKNLQGDLNMTKIAVSTVQNEMKSKLSGEMGEDMMAVLNGERFVEASFIERKKHKVKSLLKRLFKLF